MNKRERRDEDYRGNDGGGSLRTRCVYSYNYCNFLRYLNLVIGAEKGLSCYENQIPGTYGKKIVIIFWYIYLCPALYPTLPPSATPAFSKTFYIEINSEQYLKDIHYNGRITLPGSLTLLTSLCTWCSFPLVGVDRSYILSD